MAKDSKPQGWGTGKLPKPTVVQHGPWKGAGTRHSSQPQTRHSNGPGTR